MLIERTLYKSLKQEFLKEPSVIILYGPRQAGKTTLVHQLIENIPQDKLIFLNGDDIRVQELLGAPNLSLLKNAVGSNQYIIIDEAQRIPNIGLTLKLIFDELKPHIFVTGSSSFELVNNVSEPLTGRAKLFTLYPLSFTELKSDIPGTSIARDTDPFLRFGMYPKVLTTDGDGDKERYLYDVVNTYLYKDIASFGNIRKPKKVLDLLALLALQIGGEVSTAELSRHVALSKQSVERYLDILEKMFVIVNIRGFSRNMRKEIYKTSKYYFWDVGLRNAIIRNFNPLNLRSDAGALFENFFFIERMKTLNNRGQYANFYFWRTYDQKEIDIIEDRSGELFAYEIKWREGNVKPPRAWTETYPNAHFSLVTAANYGEFLSDASLP